MQPDKPELCRFWLAGLVSALNSAVPLDAFLPLDALVAFLWRYTWAAVPACLQARVMQSLRLAVDVTRPEHVLEAKQGKVSKYADIGVQLCHAAYWLLEGDGAYCEWKEGKDASELLVPIRMGLSLIHI